MTKPVNLYLQSRIEDEEYFNKIDYHVSKRTDKRQIKNYEIKSLKKVVDEAIKNNIDIESLDGFFWGYRIPQIGKEFDLLKFTDNKCLNIELKSQMVSNEQIIKQLQKNKHYLAHLEKECFFYTIVTDDMKCYMLNNENMLETIKFRNICDKIKEFKDNYITNIDDLFRARDFLVSPLNTPDKFINDEYFLTQDQEQKKRQILNVIDNNPQPFGYVCLTGTPGSGKTLLLYDIAKELLKKDKTIIIHCGKLAQGQNLLDKKIENLSIITVSNIKYTPNILDKYKYILVDETQRIYLTIFNKICEEVSKNNKICIFSIDQNQVLSKSEKNADIFSKIHRLPLLEDLSLSGKIRTNQELASFIKNIKNLNNKPSRNMDFSNVDIMYANNINEAKKIIGYYRNKGYIFINYSKSNFCYSPYQEYLEDYDTHHIIGQEFDNILMIMDSSFYYNDEGVLCGIEHPNPNYLYYNLFYQGITRVREKIAIIIIGALDLFKKMTTIFDSEC